MTHAGPTKVGVKKVGFDCSLVGIKTHCRGGQCLALTNVALKVTQMNHETKKIWGNLKLKPKSKIPQSWILKKNLMDI